MALKNRVNIATYEYDGDEIKLQANFGALERLSDETGLDALVYIQSMSGPRQIVEVFYHLQFGTTYTRAEIHDAFFAELSAFERPEVQKNLENVIMKLLGADKGKVLEELDGDETSKKK